MKTTFLLVSFLYLSVPSVNAQISETEPNDSLSIANAMPLNTTASGAICSITAGSPDWFRIVLPTDGRLNIRSNVSSPTAAPPQNFSLTLVSKHNNYYNSFNATVGGNGSVVTDSFGWCCLAADTFYIRANNSWGTNNICYNYSFSCSLTPASFNNDTEPDNFPLHPLPLTYNTSTEGHLGYRVEPTSLLNDADDYYTIITPTDGVVRIITQTEGQSLGNSTMNVTLADKANNTLYSQYATAGSFLSPHADTLYWPCIAKDTMHIQTSISFANNAGYAYRIKYDVIPPVFGNDVEANNSYAAAQVVNPNNDVDGHLFFRSMGDYDYIKFYKPDTGFLKVYVQAETYGGTNNNNFNLRLQDKLQNDVKVIYPLIGGHSQPMSDSISIASLPADSFYLVVQNSVFNMPCMSYRLLIRSTTITGTLTTGVTTTSGRHFSVFPNPSNGRFSVITDNSNAVALKVYDIYGKLVYAKLFAGEQRMEVSLPGALPGMYFVEMNDGISKTVAKLMIQ